MGGWTVVGWFRVTRRVQAVCGSSAPTQPRLLYNPNPCPTILSSHTPTHPYSQLSTNMSWQAYVDTNLIGSSFVQSAAIYGLQGGVWAASPDFKLLDDEHKAVVGAFSDPAGIRENGLHINGVRHFALQATERSIYGKKVGNMVFFALIETREMEKNELSDKETNVGKRKGKYSMDDSFLYHGSTGVCIVKTNQAIIVSFYGDGTNPGSCNKVTEGLADYLIGAGYFDGYYQADFFLLPSSSSEFHTSKLPPVLPRGHIRCPCKVVVGSRHLVTRNLVFLLWAPAAGTTRRMTRHTLQLFYVALEKDKKKKWEPPVPTRVGKKKKRGPDATSKLPAGEFSDFSHGALVVLYQIRPMSSLSFHRVSHAHASIKLIHLYSPTPSPKNTVFPTTRCRLKLLKNERIKDYLLMEEEFVQNQERLKPQEEKNQEERTRVDDLRGSPMGVGSLEEIIDDDHVIVSSSTGPEYYVSVMSFVDKDLLEPGCSVLLHHKGMAVVGVLGDDVDPMVSVMKLEKAPTESYADIGGLEQQIQEIKESVELPLTHPELYEEMGIKPPKGVILYGVPGTGKTLLAKAVANQTSATFLRVVGSELIQKYLGDGPKLVRELFRVAEEHAPSIVFIDEIDAIGTKRYDSNSGGEREIQRTMLELLNQLDGFDSRGDVKVIMATNRIESLDPALIRPGRIDRKIEFPLPDVKTKRRIFNIHTSRMTLSDDVDLEEFVMSKDDLSGADIKAICTEAGLLALRERRMKVVAEDLRKAREKVLYRKSEGTPEGLYL
ncbi:P-loop containing nucleoside triphosphate hydrolase protein [Jimgerdemannia flammicorona]|uniref:Profilin n=1 Tax=Jimgerdemannia flammicorona TaxID=994334 RepID=A0A433D886_9FUNG|nr:P-loop containing nucleoside triphosphate hydrolase protein [Jimgerdemannia flammicorona]